MIEAITALKRSLNNDLLRLNSISQNLANVTTSGYKKESLSFDQIFSANSSERLNGQMALLPKYSSYRDVAQSTLSYTSDASNISIDGPGLFVVEKAGTYYGFRSGDLRVNASGELETTRGELMQGQAGRVVLEPGPFEIDEAGVIKQNEKVVDKLLLVDFENEQGRNYLGEGLYKIGINYSDNLDGQIKVKQGYVETSNVKTMDEMVQLIDTTRHFESIYSVLKAYDDQMNVAINKLANF